jgi:hypothetical protein
VSYYNNGRKTTTAMEGGCCQQAQPQRGGRNIYVAGKQEAMRADTAFCCFNVIYQTK